MREDISETGAKGLVLYVFGGVFIFGYMAGRIGLPDWLEGAAFATALIMLIGGLWLGYRGKQSNKDTQSAGGT